MLVGAASFLGAARGTAVLPTRPGRPRDKAKVEAAVLVVERWILARLRHRSFYSLAELNAAIADLLKRLNGNGNGRNSMYARNAPPLFCPHRGKVP